MTEFNIITFTGYPEGITTGPDGALWFTLNSGPNYTDFIGRMTTNGTVQQFPVPTPNATTRAITAGPDGALWFTEDDGKIGRITLQGNITEFPLQKQFRVAVLWNYYWSRQCVMVCGRVRRKTGAYYNVWRDNRVFDPN